MAAILSLFSQATNGSTFEELQNGLHLNIDKATIASLFHEYYGSVKKSAGNPELMVANRIYVQQDLKLRKDFREVATKKFFSDVESVDFKNASDTILKINRFVRESTKEAITEIITPDIFDESSRVFLINVIYFKSNWNQPFPEDYSGKRKFYINETETIQLDSMMTNSKFWYAKYLVDLDASALRLDYANSNFSFLIVLPNNRTGLTTLEARLKNYNLLRIIDQMLYTSCHVEIPKFKIEYEIILNDILKNVCIQ